LGDPSQATIDIGLKYIAGFCQVGAQVNVRVMLFEVVKLPQPLLSGFFLVQQIKDSGDFTVETTKRRRRYEWPKLKMEIVPKFSLNLNTTPINHILNWGGRKRGRGWGRNMGRYICRCYCRSWRRVGHRVDIQCNHPFLQ
jgi:hypothetical protein